MVSALIQPFTMQEQPNRKLETWYFKIYLPLVSVLIEAVMLFSLLHEF